MGACPASRKPLPLSALSGSLQLSTFSPGHGSPQGRRGPGPSLQALDPSHEPSRRPTPTPPHPHPWLPHSWPLSLRLVLESRAGLSGQGLWGSEFCALFTGLWPCQSAGADSLPQSAGLFWEPHGAVAQASLWTSIPGPSWGGQGSWPELLSSPVQFQSRAQWVISLKGCSLSVAQTHPTGHTQGTAGGSGEADGTASQVHASQQQPSTGLFRVTHLKKGLARWFP